MFNFPAVRKDRVDNLLGLDNLFDEFFKTPVSLAFPGFESLPTVDIYRKGDKITVRAEIPGIKSDQLNVSVDDDLLTISGEKKYENEVKEKDYYRMEASYGRFERTVRLPEAVKAEGAVAVYKNGVLKIELQKSEDTKKKQIKINVN